MKRVELIIMVGLWTTVIWIGMDMYLPAIPIMDEAFSTTEQMVNATLTTFAVGLPIGALVGGSISDKLGRRLPTLVGGALFCGSLVVCACAQAVEVIVVFRLAAGLGGGVVCATTTAILKDVLDGRDLESAITVTQSLAIVGPLVAPFFGSLIVTFFSWRGIFIVLAVLGAACLLWYLRLGETLPQENRARTSLIGALGLIFQVGRNVSFTALLVSLCMPPFLFGVFMASCSYVYMDMFALTSIQYSGFYAVVSVVSICGPFAYTLLHRRIGNKRAVILFSAMLLVCGIWTLLLGRLHPVVYTVGLLPFVIAEGMARPCAFLVLLRAESERAGSASALVHFGIGFAAALGTPVAALPWPDYIVAMGVPSIAASIVGIVLFFVVVRMLRSSILDD